MSECVQVVWEKKLRRIMARKNASLKGDGKPSSRGLRLRAKEFSPR
ncbi:MAG: hypothetical protein QNJ98_14715 [Planctomycetota bacterium]|nr:hypothetical protein [Planctomycetota bacterium]